MRIWIVNISEPLPLGKGVQDRLFRAGYFANFLAENGHDVVWWTSSFEHFRKEHIVSEYTSIHHKPNFEIKLLHGCGYKKNISLSRLRDHKQVAAQFVEESRKEELIPDIIVSSVPTIELSLASVQYGQQNKIPVVLDMRDMWPDIFVDLAPKSFRPLVKLLLKDYFRQMTLACQNAATIIGITEPFVKWGLSYAGRTLGELDRWFPLGYSATLPSEEDRIKAGKFWDELGVTEGSSSFIVSYVGSINNTDHLDNIIHAANYLSLDSLRKFKFVICGVGEQLERFKKMTSGRADVLFPGWMSKPQIYVLLQRCKVGIDPLISRIDFLSTINNKAIEYLSAGLTVITYPNKGFLAEFLKKEKCGISCEENDFTILVDTLKTLYDDKNLQKRLSSNALKVFEKYFIAEKVYRNMMLFLDEVIQRHRKGL